MLEIHSSSNFDICGRDDSVVTMWHAPCQISNGPCLVRLASERIAKQHCVGSLGNRLSDGHRAMTHQHF